jgi:N-acyl-D-aspartate/D-glutamate deacylase
MLSRVEGMPLAALEAGVPWDWTTTGQYLDRLEGGLAINAGFMVGHSTIRRLAMGASANERKATPDELTSMVKLLRAGLESGGMGFSSTWSKSHNDADGNPVPSRFADADEIISLAQICRDYQGTSLEFLPPKVTTEPFDDVTSRMMVEMSRRANRPLNWNLMRVNAANVDTVDVRGRLEIGSQALESGARVVALVMPQSLLLLLSFASGFLLDTLPGWAKPMARSVEDKMHLFTNPVERERLCEMAGHEGYADWATHVIYEGFTPLTKQMEGRAVGEVALEQGKNAFDALIDVALADELKTVFHPRIPPETRADWSARAQVCRDGRALVGGSDAGAHLDMIGTHNYCTSLLANFVREHGVMSLEEAVHLLTGEPAQFYGLRNRGLIKKNMAADVVVFDEKTIGPTPLSTRHDLPTGAGRLYSDCTGIAHVIVNGESIVEHGEFTGSLPGLVLRSGRDTQNPPMRP